MENSDKSLTTLFMILFMIRIEMCQQKYTTATTNLTAYSWTEFRIFDQEKIPAFTRFG